MGRESEERERNSRHGRRWDIRVRVWWVVRVMKVSTDEAELAAVVVVGIVP